MIITTARNIHVRRRKATHITLESGQPLDGRNFWTYSIIGFHSSLRDEFYLNLHPWSTEEEARAFIQTSPYCQGAIEMTPQAFESMLRWHRFSWTGRR